MSGRQESSDDEDATPAWIEFEQQVDELLAAIPPEVHAAVDREMAARRSSSALQYMVEEVKKREAIDKFEKTCITIESVAHAISEAGPYGIPQWVAALQRACAALGRAQSEIMNSVVV